MANRRMISKDILESPRFLNLSSSAKNLYVYCLLNADDEGVVVLLKVQRIIKARPKHVQELVEEGFIEVLEENNLAYIPHFSEQNRIQPSRKKESIYFDMLKSHFNQKKQVNQNQKNDNSENTSVEGDIGKENVNKMSDKCRKDYNNSTPKCQQNDDEQSTNSRQNVDKMMTNSRQNADKMSDQYSEVEESEVEYSLGECSTACVDNTHTTDIKYQLGNEILTFREYEQLLKDHPQKTVDSVIARIINKPYKGCLNCATIDEWCSEKKQKISIYSDLLEQGLKKIVEEGVSKDGV